MNEAQRLYRRDAHVSALCSEWRDWTEAVEHHMHHRSGSYSRKSYASTHSRLLSLCNQLVESSNPEEAAFYRSLIEIARPWLSTESLHDADLDILKDLVCRCHNAGNRLGCWDHRHFYRSILFVLLGITVFFVSVFLFFQLSWSDILFSIQSWFYHVLHSSGIASSLSVPQFWTMPLLAVFCAFIVLYISIRSIRS